jgi:hypothetical protein
MSLRNKLQINWGGPVCPTPHDCDHIGMTVREFFAAAALIALVARKDVKLTQCGRLALDIADVVLEAVKEDNL